MLPREDSILYSSPSALKMQEYLRKMMRDGILDDTGWMETCIDDAGWYAPIKYTTLHYTTMCVMCVLLIYIYLSLDDMYQKTVLP